MLPDRADADELFFLVRIVMWSPINKPDVLSLFVASYSFIPVLDAF